MTTHELKTWPEYFEALADGSKQFEIRRDDRTPAFAVGDVLRLREWRSQWTDMPADVRCEHPEYVYTGRECWRRVTYVLRGVEATRDWLQPGYCIMGLEDVEQARKEDSGVHPVLERIAKALERLTRESLADAVRRAITVPEPPFEDARREALLSHCGPGGARAHLVQEGYPGEVKRLRDLAEAVVSWEAAADAAALDGSVEARVRLAEAVVLVRARRDAWNRNQDVRIGDLERCNAKAAEWVVQEMEAVHDGDSHRCCLEETPAGKWAARSKIIALARTDTRCYVVDLREDGTFGPKREVSEIEWAMAQGNGEVGP
jgi:hypothetical protein